MCWTHLLPKVFAHMNAQAIIERNNIQFTGTGQKTLLMAHGFGSDQKMWRLVSPYFERDYRVVWFDYVGSGNSDASVYDTGRYASLEGYGQDIVEICEALDLQDVTLLGHSISGTISLLAAQQIPTRISNMVMICSSPYFMNDPPSYYGGFEREELETLIDSMERNFVDWASYLAPVAMGENGSPELISELVTSLCATDPLITKRFADATFFSDYRSLLPRNQHPTLLIQSRWDALASPAVSKYMHEQMPLSQMKIINAEGHFPQMSHPGQVVAAMRAFLNYHPIP